MKDPSYFDSRDNNLWSKSNPNIDEDDVIHEGILEYEKKKVKFCLINNYFVKMENINNQYQSIEIRTARIFYKDNETLEIGRNQQYISLKSSPQNIQFWYECMRNKAILLNFHQNYVIGKQIGQGQFAQVFKVTSKRNTMIYAAKIFQKHQLIQLNVDKHSIMKEITMMRSLKHQGIIKIYEVYEDQQNIYLILELMQYSLKSQKQIHSETFCANIVLQLFSILQYIHSQNIIHRDIKPDNILFKTADQVCICDFGLADYYNYESKYQFQRCGTPGFVAPEILRDMKYDFKVDVYSVGIILYIMLVGKQPFHATSQNELVKKNYGGIIDFKVVKASKQCVSFLKWVLQDIPTQRPSSYEVLHHEWFAKIFGEQKYFQLLNQREDINKLNNQLQCNSINNSLEVSNFQAIQNQMDEEESEQEEPQLQQAIKKYQEAIKQIEQQGQQQKQFEILRDQLASQHTQMTKN